MPTTLNNLDFSLKFMINGGVMAETFEEKAAAMSGLSQKEMVERLESMKEVCKSYCGESPSYTGTGETRLVFCMGISGR
jgi:hypothetical protein